MSDKQTINIGGNITALSLLGVALVVLKLCHTIDWSWWWVLLPFYGVAAGCIAVLFVYAFAVLICAGIEWVISWRRK